MVTRVQPSPFEKFHMAVKKFRMVRKAPKTRVGLLGSGSGSLELLLERRAFAREHRERGVHRGDVGE